MNIYLIILFIFILSILPSRAADIHAETLISGRHTILNQPIVYPKGVPQITAQVVTVAPHAHTGWHIHEVPSVGYILEGAIEVDYGARGKRIYKADSALFEAINFPHNGYNPTNKPARVLVVYIGATGLANSKPIDE